MYVYVVNFRESFMKCVEDVVSMKVSPYTDRELCFWRCGLVEVGVALLKEKYYWGLVFEDSDSQANPSVIL